MSNPACLSTSLSSKALPSGGGNESQMEEGPQRDSVDGEGRRGSESRETDVVNGMTAAAEVTHHHRGSADKQKFNTLGFKASDMGQTFDQVLFPVSSR